jgi:hypothetical protein
MHGFLSIFDGLKNDINPLQLFNSLDDLFILYSNSHDSSISNESIFSPGVGLTFYKSVFNYGSDCQQI